MGVWWVGCGGWGVKMKLLSRKILSVVKLGGEKWGVGCGVGGVGCGGCGGWGVERSLRWGFLPGFLISQKTREGICGFKGWYWKSTNGFPYFLPKLSEARVSWIAWTFSLFLFMYQKKKNFRKITDTNFSIFPRKYKKTVIFYFRKRKNSIGLALRSIDTISLFWDKDVNCWSHEKFRNF